MTDTPTSNGSSAARARGLEGALVERIAELAPTLLCVLDVRDRRIVACNRAFVRALGIGDEEALERGWETLISRIHPEDLGASPAHLEQLRAANDGEPLEGSLRARSAGGVERTFALRCLVLARGDDDDDGGAVRQILLSAEDVTDRKRREMELQKNEALLQAFLEHMPAMMFAKDPDSRYVVANAQFDRFMGMGPQSITGKRDADLLPEDIVSQVKAADDEVRNTGVAAAFEESVPHPTEGMKQFYSVKFPVQGPGIPAGTIGGAAIDITAIKQAEAERQEAQQAIIAAQQATIRELATPLMPIADGVLVMPLIGTLDPERASRIIEALLDGVGAHQAAIAIIDITGVRSVDAHVAGVLLQAARAVKLLGARVVLTGIQPAIARTLVDLGVDWQGLVTEATLRGGIDYALRTRERRGGAVPG
ncbi:PAS domain-containing protein [Sorangium sp. So ce260]|uniref:PAS domain-containing protein n=1 Tax=Sorangium sp. So ce260 TaxID=3133291 RepID=UPI003F5ED5F4